jgi:cephalosporin-C deacetylase-like acetyl esterase
MTYNSWRNCFVRARLSAALAALIFAVSAANAQPRANTPEPLNFRPYHENGIYQVGEKAGWTVTMAPGVEAPAAGYAYTVKTNNFQTIKSGTLDLSSGSATIEASVNEPAMLYVEITPNRPPANAADQPPANGAVPASGAPAPPPAASAPPSSAPTSPAAAPNAPPRGPRGPRRLAMHLGAAVAPEKLKPSVPRPADFDTFWDAKLKALSEVPMNPQLTPMETATPGVELYTIKLDSLGSHVQGYLSKPSREGKFPALILYQWAGVYAIQPKTAVDRAAEGWLFLNVSAHDLPPSQATGVPSNYAAVGNTDRETSYFLNMYLRDVRAIDYIASRPDWDGKTIVVLGTSMGAHQSFVAAGLSPKVTAVIANEPSGTDSNGSLAGRKIGYPDWASNDPKTLQTGLYFDVVNFASRIKAPVLVAVGFIDTTCPPAGVWTTANQIPGPKEVIGMVESDHNNLTPQKQGAWDARSKEVLTLILSGGQFKPNAQTPQE